MSSNPNKRLLVLAGFLALWFIAICVRLVRLQVFQYGDFTQRAARQQQRSIEVSPVRGIIYDRNGNDLAESVSVDSIFAVPSEIADVRNTSEILAKILKTDPAEIGNRMRASHAFAWVARKVDADTSNRVRALGLKGIYFQKESKRFYPKRELAAQVLGYVGLDDEGLGGMEREFDARLKGKPGAMLISMDAKRRWFGRVEKNPDPGENIVLTIDEKIQYIAERELEQAMRDSHAEAGTIIVENPHTGAVLALANRPTFNPNKFNTTQTQSLRNRAVSDIYEPGSTFKIVTLSAALEEKLTNPDEVIDCQMGSIVVNGLRIHDHHPYGALTVRQILQHSSDVGAIKLALRLGEERFDRYIRAFGFGSQTGIELPAETRGLTKPVSRWSKVSIGAISMGQEIGVSPLQLIGMVSTIANDGVYVPPRIIMGTTAPRSTAQLVAFHPAPEKRVISSLTAAQMKQMMEGVVLRGTGTRAILNGYSSAGKTGTAQKIDPSTGAYSRSKYIASFTGFAPVNNPALTVLVILDSPVGPHEGAQVAAPVFARVAQQVLAYWNVTHDIEVLDPKKFLLRAKAKEEDLTEASPDRIAMETELMPLPAPPPVPNLQTVKAETKITAAEHTCGTSAGNCKNTCGTAAPGCGSSSIPNPTPTSANSTVVLDVAGGIEVPDFSGKPLRAALEQAEEAGIELEVSGSGLAQTQSPAAGSHIPHGGHVSVRFGR
ncbi:MAG TPA: penicillin-binding protein [Candidatus Angelobacter sp.]|nr:penicillin-binding protein [Candidatus Angelobacter sp.]